MNARLICATLLIIGMGTIGCGAPEPPLACMDEPFPWWEEGDFVLEYCSEMDMVCNEAVTLADECPGFLEELEVYFREFLIPQITERLEYLPWEVDLEGLVDYLFIRLSGGCAQVNALAELGTCQPAGNEEDPCLEDADCREDLVCLEEMCLPPQQEECMDDLDCPEELVCLEGECVVPEPGCETNDDCEPELWCWEGECVLPG